MKPIRCVLARHKWQTHIYAARTDALAVLGVRPAFHIVHSVVRCARCGTERTEPGGSR